MRNRFRQLGHILRVLTSSILFVAHLPIFTQYYQHDFENQLDRGPWCGTVVSRAMHEVPAATALPPIPPLEAIVSPLKDFGSSKPEAQPEHQHWTNARREASTLTIDTMNKMIERIEALPGKIAVSPHVPREAMFILHPDAHRRFMEQMKFLPRTCAKITNIGELP